MHLKLHCEINSLAATSNYFINEYKGVGGHNLITNNNQSILVTFTKREP